MDGETQTALESSKSPGGGRAHLHRAHLLASLAVWYKVGRHAHVGSLRIPGLACDLEKDPVLWVHAALASSAQDNLSLSSPPCPSSCLPSANLQGCRRGPSRQVRSRTSWKQLLAWGHSEKNLVANSMCSAAWLHDLKSWLWCLLPDPGLLCASVERG